MTTKTIKSLAENVRHSVCKAAVVAAFAAVSLSAPALAQELKIGYVNSERVLREATPAKAALARMEADFSKRDKDLNDQAALAEIGLHAGQCGLGRCGLAQHTLAVDIADLQLLGQRGCTERYGSKCRHRRCLANRVADILSQ